MKNKLMIVGLGVSFFLVSLVMMVSGADRFLPLSINGALRIIIMVVAAIGVSLLINLAASRVYAKIGSLLKPVDELSDDPGEDDAEPEAELSSRYREYIADYLNKNKSTPFFRDTLSNLSAQLESFQKRHVSLNTILEARFGAGGLSYGKFSSSVNDLRSYLMKLASNLLLKMEAFDEEDYEEKINRFLQQNRLEEADAHKRVEMEYTSYAQSVTKQFDGAILKMDRLILEMGKLSDAELEKAMDALLNMEDTIKDTRMYGV